MHYYVCHDVCLMHKNSGQVSRAEYNSVTLISLDIAINYIYSKLKK